MLFNLIFYFDILVMDDTIIDVIYFLHITNFLKYNYTFAINYVSQLC